MAIAVVCPGCGKRYRVAPGLAGKRLRCPCGQRLEVGSIDQDAERPFAEAAPLEDEDWVAAAFAPPEPRVAQPSRLEQPPLPPPLPLAASEEAPDAATFPGRGPTDFSALSPRDLLRHLQAAVAPPGKARSKAAVRRLVVGCLALVYGVVMTLVLAARLFLDPPDGVFALSNRLAAIVLAGCVAVGGWLILKRHPQGPAWAGLASLFLCFPSAAGLLLNMLGHYAAGQWRWLGAAALQGAALFAIPAVVIAWCLKMELGRQRRQQQREEHPFLG